MDVRRCTNALARREKKAEGELLGCRRCVPALHGRSGGEANQRGELECVFIALKAEKLQENRCVSRAPWETSWSAFALRSARRNAAHPYVSRVPSTLHLAKPRCSVKSGVWLGFGGICAGMSTYTRTRLLLEIVFDGGAARLVRAGAMVAQAGAVWETRVAG